LALGYEGGKLYSHEEARNSVLKKLNSLRKEPILRKIPMTADRVGIDQVLEFMCGYGGPMYIQFNRTGGYFVPLDDLRRCVFEFRSKLRHQDTISKTVYHRSNF